MYVSCWFQTNEIDHFGNSWLSSLNEEAECMSQCEASAPLDAQTCTGEDQTTAQETCNEIANTTGRFAVRYCIHLGFPLKCAHTSMYIKF